MKTSNHSLKDATISGNLDIIQLNDLARRFPSNIQSLNATSASPILAVTSRIFKSKVPKIEEIALNAIFKPPPRIVVMISRTANTPLKVRCNF